MACDECVWLAGGGVVGMRHLGTVIRSGVFWWVMTARPIERNFIPHSTTLARGRMTGNRWRAGWLGVVLAASWGECRKVGVGRGLR